MISQITMMFFSLSIFSVVSRPSPSTSQLTLSSPPMEPLPREVAKDENENQPISNLIDPTMTCTSDWQCLYGWSCLEGSCTKASQPDQDLLSGSDFALAVQSLLLFTCLALFLCSPCLVLIFIGFYLGYCPDDGSEDEMEVKKNVLKGKKKEGSKMTEVQARVLAKVNQLPPVQAETLSAVQESASRKKLIVLKKDQP